MSIFSRNVFQSDLDTIDGLSGFPEPTFWSKWFGGIIVPMLLFASGARDCIEKQAELIDKHGNRMKLDGTEAMALGLAWISVACFLHVHYFWTAFPRLAVLSELGKTVSALGLIVSLGYVFWSIISGWI